MTSQMANIDFNQKKADERTALLNSNRVYITRDVWLAIGLTISLCGAFSARWFLLNSGDREGVLQVLLCSSACFVMRSIIYGSSFLLGYHYVLPKYVGADLDDIHELCGPGTIPVDKWISKYGEEKILVRDGLQRKIPHMLFLVFDISAWTWAIQTWHLQPDAIFVVSVLYRGFIVVSQSLTLHYSTVMSERCWYLLSSTLHATPRIRDGQSRWNNLASVALLSLWGVLASKFLWFTFIVPLYPLSQSALLLQLIWMPVAIGDAMAEIVGSVWGKHRFEVTGVGDKNTKSIEGVVAMFMSVLLTSIGAAFLAKLEGRIAPGTMHGWIMVSFMIAVGTTIAETYSPRSTDNFTIPLVAAVALHIAGLTFLAA
eukprot:TRINITY_DN14867_c0_g1_i2.p1 TRINITY_DN14867_c0_g1~~TRINITY_DN14867_c0_g1_i2.p1  ORF type:complete len:371 (+),score=19.43 TRINITY_DN14867_c0_g1_i2:74-1186(+)